MFSNCILHRQGQVTVDSCQLECYAGGLGHLFSPLITMAVSGLSRQQRLQGTLRKQEAGMGVLSVTETVIRVSLVRRLLTKQQAVPGMPT